MWMSACLWDQRPRGVKQNQNRNLMAASVAACCCRDLLTVVSAGLWLKCEQDSPSRPGRWHRRLEIGICWKCHTSLTSPCFISPYFPPTRSSLLYRSSLVCHACWDTYETERRRCVPGYLAGLSLGCMSMSSHTSENSSHGDPVWSLRLTSRFEQESFWEQEL